MGVGVGVSVGTCAYTGVGLGVSSMVNILGLTKRGQS